VNLSGSTLMSGSAVFSGMSALVSRVVSVTATSGRSTASRSARPASIAARATKWTLVVAGTLP
jgi:hypothetical protein